MSTGAGFTHPEYLADPGWLQAHLSNPNLVVVDLDAEAGYLRGHIPGAVHLANNYERNPETGWVNTQPPKRFAATCQRLGIGDATLVVAYDNNLSLYAARFWWALNYYGHRNVRVLDGGWRRWVAEGGQISFDRAIPRSGAAFTPEVVQSLIAGFDEVWAGCSPDDRAGRRHGYLGYPQRRRVFRRCPPGQQTGRPRHRGGAPGLAGHDGPGDAPFQARAGNSANAQRPGNNPGQSGLCLLTGRPPCGARRIFVEPAGLRPSPQL